MKTILEFLQNSISKKINKNDIDNIVKNRENVIFVYDNEKDADTIEHFTAKAADNNFFIIDSKYIKYKEDIVGEPKLKSQFISDIEQKDNLCVFVIFDNLKPEIQNALLPFIVGASKKNTLNIANSKLDMSNVNFVCVVSKENVKNIAKPILAKLKKIEF
jgi:hypothetical protein